MNDLWMFVGGRLLWDNICLGSGWPQQPIPLSGVGLNGAAEPVCESEVWEVLFDTYTQSSDIISSSSSKILPVMMCSEDGILAVVEQGKPIMSNM